MPLPVHADLTRLPHAVAPGLPDEVLARTLLAWSAVLGAISYERFGHLHGIIADHDAYFAHQMQRAARLVISRNLAEEAGAAEARWCARRPPTPGRTPPPPGTALDQPSFRRGPRRWRRR